MAAFDMSRREFMTKAALTAAALGLPQTARARRTETPTSTPEVAAASSVKLSGSEPLAGSVELHWLEGSTPALAAGTTWGVPWPRGAFKKNQTFALQTQRGEALPVQTWPLAYWPDGTLKWTGHALGANVGLSQKLSLSPGLPAPSSQVVVVRETPEMIEVDTGALACRIAKHGSFLIESLKNNGREIMRAGRLVALRGKQPETDAQGIQQQETFTSSIEQVTVEQRGPVRAVVKLDGKHQGAGGRAWLPFTVRLYFYAGGEAVRVMHTFIFDGDENRDFVCGLGLQFTVPMRDHLHDRHVRFAGEGRGLWAEAIRNLTGLRRDPGEAARQAQTAGLPTPPPETFPPAARDRLQYVPAWGDFTLSQLSADGFQIRKRTQAGHGWIAAGAGRRAAGLGYIGGVSGGVAFGLRDFWQRHPTQLDIRNAHTDQAEVRLWLWSPEAPPMDMRFYHDGLGMSTHAEELQGLEITYEDYEKGFGSPVGIARTSELMLWALPATPTRERLVEMADAVRHPPLLACRPQHLLATQVFGGLFSLPDRSTPAKRQIEDQLDYLIALYQSQIEQQRWYGFWDYGDVMHSYDGDRHAWRYDVGGYAWANSELSPDLWFWYSYLRSGRADIFRMAEAMTRHTGEVDVYHLGRFKGLGTRHGVQHWGDSAKQARISTAAYRRFYYYLTADERVGDLLRELVEVDKTFLALDPIRKIRQGEYKPDPRALAVGFGTDWGSLASAWLTEWERTLDPKPRDKLLNGMQTIGSMPHGFYTSGSIFYDSETGRFTLVGEPGSPRASHLSAVFGLAEISAELIQLFDVPEFERAWLQYCELYNAGAAEQTRQLGRSLGKLNLGEAHSRLTAYAAYRKNDSQLAARAWREFYAGAAGLGVRSNLQTRHIEGPAVLNPLDEGFGMSTNAASQWGLAAIQNLALIGEHLPSQPPARSDGVL